MTAREEFELIETRTISGKGILKFPESDDYRHFYLYVDVVRFPRIDFSNSKWNPDRSEYAKITWIIDEYVAREDVLNYPQQRYDWAVDPTGYIASYLVCAIGGIVAYLDYLAPFIPATPLPTDPTRKIYAEPLKYVPSRINFVCRESTAIEVSLYGLKYDVACDDAEPSPKDPPPPPVPSPVVPPGTPILIDPPYDGENDNDNTVPFPDDETPPPPDELPDATLLRWNVSTVRVPRTSYADAVFTTFTPVSGYSVVPGNTDPGLNARQWLTTFISGTSTVNGSAVGNLSPEDKPVLFLWRDGVTDAPWRVIFP